MDWLRHMQLRWKLLIMVMPLVLVPLLLITVLVSTIAMELAYEGITRASRDDLKHISDFSLDLIDEHYRQYEVYKKEKETAMRQKLHEIVDLAYTLVETHHEQYLRENLPLESVKKAARNGLKLVSVGRGGYVTVMDGVGNVLVHPVSEGHNIYDARGEDGRYFIREMCESAMEAPRGTVLYTKYFWQNTLLGERQPREKVVAYRYFEEWGWVISAGSYLDEIYQGKPFENKAFTDLKKRLKSKRVGKTGFIYAADCDGNLTIHPHHEGQSVHRWLSGEGLAVYEKLCDGKGLSSWSRSVHNRDLLGSKERIVIARLEYFRPWDWVVFVEAYEDELFGSAVITSKHILASIIFLCFLLSGIAGLLTFYVASRFTYPIYKMTEEIARVKGSRLVRKIEVPESLELRKLATAFNTMSDLLQSEKALEEKLVKMEKMASIGIISSGVAHEINNPMGVILGYACHMENKLDRDDPNYHFVQEIKEESRRCVKIVRNLLDYARVPNLTLERIDVNDLLDQLVDFAAGHAGLENITVKKDFDDGLEPIMVDGDQLRQVVMNLVLNGAAAMDGEGELTITTRGNEEEVTIIVKDSGRGIAPGDLRDVYEPFFTTKGKGTGLGLAISRQIVEAHLGRMEIASKPGAGTEVTVTLPVESPEGQEPKRQSGHSGFRLDGGREKGAERQ